MNLSRKQIVGWIVLVFVTQGAWGQIVPVQDGRALDSNYRLGSGRVNTATPRRTTFSSQMYITGQVTGLGAFRGTTGYSAANQLRMTVPSSALSDFRRQSVGLSDVLAGQTYRTGQYLDRSTTALGLRGITSGLTAPGTNVPRRSYLEGLVPLKDLDAAMSDFRPLLGTRVGRAISSPIQPAIRIDPSVPRVVDPRGFRSGSVAPKTLGASELAVFTVSRPSQRNEVDVELQELDRLGDDDLTRVDSKVRAPAVARPAAGTEGGIRTALGSKSIAETKGVESDVFLRLVYLLGKQHLDSSGGTGIARPVDPKGGDPDMKLKPLGARPGSVELVEQGLRGELVFNTLVGKGAGIFNAAMRKGEKQLKSGHFYNAADQYRLAAEIEPRNPTARIGLAVALFGAGESLSAALQLRRAMEIFPPVMVTSLKVVRKIPSEKFKGKLDKIYQGLKERKGANVNPQLAMLATYMHRSAGEMYTAEVCARKLKGAAGDDKLYSAYATYVITGKRPGAMKPTTRPARSK
ncbi:MAG: hypothetical protein QGH60_23030 [Phycisphaerae bacterium]|jgi:hypothetical protein|nr:hypothetical protein [Phycisphaerae bacterium]